MPEASRVFTLPGTGSLANMAISASTMNNRALEPQSHDVLRAVLEAMQIREGVPFSHSQSLKQSTFIMRIRCTNCIIALR